MNMKTTRILLGDKSGVLCEAALRLRWMLPDISHGACTVRSADTSEPLTHWQPDVVLLDPNLDDSGEAASTPKTRTPLDASRVLVLSLSYEPEHTTRPTRTRQAENGHLASATVEAVEMKNPVLVRYVSRQASDLSHLGQSRISNDL